MLNSEFVKAENLTLRILHFKSKKLAFFRCLTEEEVFHDYMEAEKWLEYRKKVVQNVIDVKKRISPSLRGSTG